MAIDDPNSVDAVGMDPESGLPMMVIVDDHDWSDVAMHFTMLQQKLTGYIGFIKSGQLEETMPEAKGLRPRVVIFQQFKPPEVAMQLLDQLGDQLTNADIDFDYGPLPDGYQTPA